MTFPGVPLPNQWTDLEGLNAVKLNARIDVPLNALQAAMPAGFLADLSSGTSATFVTPAVDYASATVGFTLAAQRRVRIFVKANFTMVGGTSGHYTIAPAWYATASPFTVDANRKITGGGGYTAIVSVNPVLVSVTGSSGSTGQSMEGTVLLPAGSYGAFAVLQRLGGGGTTDLGGAFYIAVHDMGSN